MFFDCHVHTRHFSEDGLMTLQEALEAAEGAGGVITLTEHFDYDFPAPYTFRFDPVQYFQAFGGRRDPKRLLLGIEIGLQPSCAGRNDKLVQAYPFDLVVASTHVVDGMDISEEAYFQGKEKKEAYRRYLECVYENIAAYDNYDVMGHIDYIARYGPYEDRSLSYSDHREILDEILNHLVKKNKVLEMNTRCLQDAAAVRALAEIYQRYHSLGGRFVTFGSDAHESRHIFGSFSVAERLADECGLRQVYFTERDCHFAIA